MRNTIVVLAATVALSELLEGILDACGAGAVLLSSGAHSAVPALLGTLVLVVLRFVLLVVAPSVLVWKLVGAAHDRAASRWYASTPCRTSS